MPVTWSGPTWPVTIECMTTQQGTSRVEGSVTSISWIPSEAVEGAFKAGFKLRVSSYDQAPPDDLGSEIGATLDELVANDRFRFANHLSAFAEFDQTARWSTPGTSVAGGSGGRT